MTGIIITRDQWGAQPQRPGATPRNAVDVTTTFVHYSDAHESIPAPSEAADAQIVRAIQRYHLERGYVDIAYEALIGPAGDIFVGRSNLITDASTCDHNRDGYGICLLTDGPVTPQQWASARFCVELGRLRFPNLAAVPEPHSAACPTHCPGDAARALITWTEWE